MYGSIVRCEKVRQYINPPIISHPRKVSPHLGLDSTIESFAYGCLELRFQGEESNIFNVKQVLYYPIVKLATAVRLQTLRLATMRKNMSKCSGNLITCLVLQR